MRGPAEDAAGPARGAPRGPLRPQAALLFVLFGLVVTLAGAPTRPPAFEWVALAAATALPVWWSLLGTAPPGWSLAVFLVAGAVLLAARLEMGGAVVFVLIGTGLASVALGDREALALWMISLGLALLAALRAWLQVRSPVALTTVVPSYAVAGGFVIAGRLRRRHQQETERLLADLESEHRRLEVAHAALAEHARRVAELSAAEERNRIAAEIHDVLAHALTAIIVQAEAAAIRLRADPAGAAGQVSAVAALARDALQEARLSVAAIRADPGAGGLDALRRLCDEATRLGGLRCTCGVEGPERPLPAPIAHAAHRVLQEALTNARRHGAAEHVTVACAFLPGTFALTVTDDGRGSGEAEVVPGSGLRGMRERAARADGRLQAGPLPAGPGFRVRVELPLPADASED